MNLKVVHGKYFYHILGYVGPSYGSRTPGKTTAMKLKLKKKKKQIFF